MAHVDMVYQTNERISKRSRSLVHPFNHMLHMRTRGWELGETAQVPDSLGFGQEVIKS